MAAETEGGKERGTGKDGRRGGRGGEVEGGKEGRERLKRSRRAVVGRQIIEKRRKEKKLKI